VLNLVSKRFWFFGLSLLVIIPGVIALLVWHLNLGLDFTSGTVVDLQFSKNVDANVVKQAFAKAGAKDLSVVVAQDTSADPKFTFWLRFNVAIDDATEQDVVKALNDLAGQIKPGVGGANADGAGDFSRLVTYDGCKTYFSILAVHFTGFDATKGDKPPAVDQIRKAIANIKDLKTSQQPTPTPTRVPTATPTTTGTPATATPTATSTPSPTPTNTPTPTPTGQPTATSTAAPTGSPTAAPTATATPVPNRTIPVLLCDDASLKEKSCGDGNAIQQGSSANIITMTTSTSFDDKTIQNIEYGVEQSQKAYLIEQAKDTVGPTIASDTTSRAFLAVLLASTAILLYVWFAFRKVAKPWRYGTCAIIALLHDVLVVLGMAAILGHFVNFKVDSLFVTAVLTVIGFSVHDTIVVFDRIRENFQRRTSETLEQVVNASLVQTMARSLNTSMTVLFTLTALTLFGGTSIREFTLTLLIGIFSGTYSSIFNASMLLVSWEKGELGRLFGIKPKPPQDPRIRRAVRARA
jgi:preprotein translocase SecF subunit